MKNQEKRNRITESTFYYFLKRLKEFGAQIEKDKLRIRPKPIRDGIPQMLEDSSTVEKLKKKDYLQYMKMKVLEEYSEFLVSGKINEYCDLLDVLERIKNINGWSDEDIEQIREDKKNRKGKFERNLVLFERSEE